MILTKGHLRFEACAVLREDGTPAAIARWRHPDLPDGELIIGFTAETFAALAGSVLDALEQARVAALAEQIAIGHAVKGGPS